MRRGYTLVEVLVAMALLMVLMVPLGWMTVQTAFGKAWARRIDDAVALAREDWGLVRRLPPAKLRDSVWERTVGEHVYRVVRRVQDSLPDPAGSFAAAPEVGSSPASRRRGPTVRDCVLEPADDPDDSIRCFSWRVPLAEVQP